MSSATTARIRSDHPAAVLFKPVSVGAVHPDGAVHWLSAQGSYFYDAQGPSRMLRAQPIDIGAMFSELRELLASAFGTGVRIIVDVGQDLPRAYADRSQLETVLINLATNGVDAMDGGGELTLTARREAISRARDGLAPGDYVRIGVADAGAGMDGATLSRACEPFFTTKPVGKGSGLGLSMARGFAEQSGGALTIASEPGVGTHVMLWLSVAGSTPEAEAPEPQTLREASILPARILLVDDGAMIAELLTENLREHGLQVTTETGGAAALATLQSGAGFDLLVSDLSMPDVNGLDIARAARARQPGFPVIILTGYAGALDREKQPGGDITFLRKPLTGDQLLDAIKLLLRDAESPTRSLH